MLNLLRHKNGNSGGGTRDSDDRRIQNWRNADDDGVCINLGEGQWNGWYKHNNDDFQFYLNYNKYYFGDKTCKWNQLCTYK